ncbi:FH2 domain-containing protein 1-like [Ahaetulla prasina]|uniref:FH2 domain-containing protein 1-like n=1 Tax=Ahaetulla prasina TaxID=499056 RepID=UPI002647EECE|nr:FH2 domain-containing protein 1-like [Ahaetulla prasina]
MVTLEGASAAASPEEWTGPGPGPPSPSASGAAAAASSARNSPAGPSLPPPPPPPPPPPAAMSLVDAAPCERAADKPSARRPVRLRNFNWEAIPAERIRGRPNLWTAARRRGEWTPDWRLLEELFGQRPEPAGSSLRAVPATEQASLLDAKKILNLGIFLKQFKRPVQDIVTDIHHGTGVPYGPEKLLELFKMLPDRKEVEKLESFQGDRSHLSEAEVFALLLVQVPSYARRLELLVLKLQLLPQLSALQSAIQTLTKAALELLGCEELHDLIRLVLKTGNYLNEGGYAGSACGFHVSSLLRLPDTRGNQPGMDLLHFVALEAERKDPSLLHFSRKLQHAAPASRINAQEVAAELQTLEQRLLGAQGDLEGLGLEGQMGPFLHVAELELRAVKAAQQDLQRVTTRLSDFLCEDPEAFCLPECCGIFHAFGERFLMAIEENQTREAAMHREQQRRQQEQAKQKRRSIATCSSQDPGLQDMDPVLFALWAPSSGRRNRPLRGPRPSAGSSRGQERSLHLNRRHTLTMLPPCPKPLEAAPEPPPPAPLSHSNKPRCFSQNLKVLLSTHPAVPASPTSAQGPLSPSTFRLPALFQVKGPESPASPISKEVCSLVGFLRRLSIGEKPRSPS